MNPEQLVQEMIQDSYPGLRDKKVHVYKGGFGTLRGMAVRIFNWYFILIHPEELRSPKENLIGFFAHELCHLEMNLKIPWSKKFFYTIRYWTNMKVFAKGEKATDRCAIEKGYGKALYAQALTRPERIGKNAKYYLTAAEVKAYAKRIKKWN